MLTGIAGIDDIDTITLPTPVQIAKPWQLVTMLEGTFLTIPCPKIEPEKELTKRDVLVQFRYQQLAHAVAPEHTLPVVGADLGAGRLSTRAFPELGTYRNRGISMFQRICDEARMKEAAIKLESLGITVRVDMDRVGWTYGFSKMVFPDVLSINPEKLLGFAARLDDIKKRAFITSRLEAHLFERSLTQDAFDQLLTKLLEAREHGGHDIRDLMTLMGRSHLARVYEREIGRRVEV